MLKKNFLKISIIAFIVLNLPIGILSAQVQDPNSPFSGNNPSSYACYDRQGNVVGSVPIIDPSLGIYYCNENGVPGFQACSSGIYDGDKSCDPQAVLKPPTLQQLEVWFVRIVYAIWALAAFVSVFGIIAIGYQYMISRGAPEATVKVKDRLAKFIVGFALVFLAIPILNTVFRVLAVNDEVQCYQGLTNNNIGIGFQFIFPELCTAPNLENAVSANEVCDEVNRLYSTGDLNTNTGLACGIDGQTTPECMYVTAGSFSASVYFKCDSNLWITNWIMRY